MAVSGLIYERGWSYMKLEIRENSVIIEGYV